MNILLRGGGEEGTDYRELVGIPMRIMGIAIAVEREKGWIYYEET